jgi:hypothetical protein
MLVLLGSERLLINFLSRPYEAWNKAFERSLGFCAVEFARVL